MNVINFPINNQKDSSNLRVDGNLALDKNNNFNEEENDEKNLYSKSQNIEKRTRGTRSSMITGAGTQAVNDSAQVGEERSGITEKTFNKTSEYINGSGGSAKNFLRGRDHESVSQLNNLSTLGKMQQKKIGIKNNQRIPTSDLKLSLLGQSNKEKRNAQVQANLKLAATATKENIKNQNKARKSSRLFHYHLYKSSWANLIPSWGFSYGGLVYCFIGKYIHGSKSFPHFFSVVDPLAEERIKNNTDKLDLGAMLALIAFVVVGAILAFIIATIMVIAFIIILFLTEPFAGLQEVMETLRDLAPGVLKPFFGIVATVVGWVAELWRKIFK